MFFMYPFFRGHPRLRINVMLEMNQVTLRALFSGETWLQLFSQERKQHRNGNMLVRMGRVAS